MCLVLMPAVSPTLKSCFDTAGVAVRVWAGGISSALIGAGGATALPRPFEMHVQIRRPEVVFFDHAS
jgi:hypothetical protein